MRAFTDEGIRASIGRRNEAFLAAAGGSRRPPSTARRDLPERGLMHEHDPSGPGSRPGTPPPRPSAASSPAS
ncbi:hypothetical protein QJS66_11155 [Kocuria rhizophila]|nr:hypothetical protein QJS66_11155 [Kocuria rhizophila]